jgi:hypothetical protein
MRKFKIQNIEVNICIDINEWAKEFYDLDLAAFPEYEVIGDGCSGFAEIGSKAIWIFIPEGYGDKDLKSIIAHEVGHVFGHSNVPSGAEEEKANHYERFYLLVDEIVTMVQVHDFLMRGGRVPYSSLDEE